MKAVPGRAISDVVKNLQVAPLRDVVAVAHGPGSRAANNANIAGKNVVMPCCLDRRPVHGPAEGVVDEVVAALVPAGPASHLEAFAVLEVDTGDRHVVGVDEDV